QIMSMLETRTLDFDNLIIMSMNERIFPRKHFAGTFIPNALRSGYGMSTIDHQESIFAYYFYRLLTRAKRVSLLYDSRTAGISSGEMSRYLYQLKYIGCYSDISFRMIDYVPSSPVIPELSVEKKVADLDQFREGGHHALSASALKTYAACPLKFYMQYVKRWNTDDDDIVKEYMTPVTYGNVIHHVAQRMFEQLRGSASTITVTDELLEKLKTVHAPDDPLTPFIEQLICEEINREFHNLSGEQLRRPLRGQSRLLADIMIKTVRSMLDAEKSYAPFEFYRAEYGGDAFVWELAEDLRVRFKMSVDRVDIVDGGRSLRFIDYKTGSDGIYSGAMHTLASRAGEHEYGAVFQLMTYAMAYTDCFGDGRPVQPFIYKLGKVVSDGLVPVRTSKSGAVIKSHLDYIDKFRDGFVELVRDIFDTQKPFVQCPNGDIVCRYCRFAEMCGRVSSKN
ncbi:MAG: PD-(D/E)XK nuclease family protein, partial [Muribaculaceae bacterium]|nr:PD-(D/E)XK nuclease family protein [Muribaculaceae bacterium]